jgi:hypothetical protein
MKIICVEAKATPRRDKAIDAIVQNIPSSGRKAWANVKSMGGPFRRSTLTSIGMRKAAGPFINIEVRDESKASNIAADLATVGGCYVKVMDEIEHRSEQMGEPEGRA